ncbi:MAG: preprotein translocase subunit SecE [Chthoniobacterales bacterium]
MASPGKFISEVRTELAKASWPWDTKEKGAKRYKEIIDSTSVTVIGILLLSAFIAFWDYILLVVVGWLTK